MSFFPAQDPAPGDALRCDAIAHIIVPRATDLGGFQVRRALPSAQRRMVGPFIFLDHMGPAEFRAGQGIDVRPHPHIGLATVTYLYAGEIVHRDSLGTQVPIRAHEVNWMTAGRGIVHSERTGAERRLKEEFVHGLQCWVALPVAEEERAPAFAHHDADELPVVRGEGKAVRIVAGALYGTRSPVATLWDTVFADVELEAGATLPLDADHEERAIYLVDGEIDIAGDRFARPTAGLSPRRSHRDSCGNGGTARHCRRCGHGWSASYLVELRLFAQRADRAGEGGVEGRAVFVGTGRHRVHSLAGTLKHPRLAMRVIDARRGPYSRLSQGR
jgi:redox-sensitive bicupin YhaK (pirin superfamily)